MITSLGFSKKLGQVAWQQSSGPAFLGNQMAQPLDYSMQTADTIDGEV